MAFIETIDNTFKTLLFTKFGDDLDLTSQNTGVIQEPKRVSLRKIAEKRGQNSVEFISFWRERVSEDLSRMNTPVARKGFYLQYTDGNQTDITTVKAVPVKIEYSVRFWSRDLSKVTDAVERFLFWRQTDPNLIFNYSTNYPVEMDILPQSEIFDESTIDTQYDTGLYFVNTANVALEGWLFDSFSTKTILSIIANVYLREVVSGANVDTLLTTYTVPEA